MAAIALQIVEQITDSILPEVESDLDAENLPSVNRLIWDASRGRIPAINHPIFLRWRNIARGYGIGNLREDVIRTLSGPAR